MSAFTYRLLNIREGSLLHSLASPALAAPGQSESKNGVKNPRAKPARGAPYPQAVERHS